MKLTEFLLTIQNQLKVFHWQTKSHAEHKALDSAYDSFNELNDQFMEAYMGKYGREEAKDQFNIILENYDDSFESKINAYIKILEEELPKGLKDKDTDLLNIRDEMLATLHQLLYLLSLK